MAGLSAHPEVTVDAVSSLWRTAAVGGPEQPDYLNAVVLVDTDLDARALLALAHELEDAAGRVREVRWGPRTLDVDLLAVGDERSDDPELTLPHPRAHERSFVLDPVGRGGPRVRARPGHRPGTNGRRLGRRVTDQSVEKLEGGPWWR